MEFEEHIDKLKEARQEADEYDDDLSLKKIKDILVGISNLILDEDQYNQMKAYFLLGSLVTKMQNVLEDQE